ncbi:MAG: acyltransferase family protein [Methylococcales bacterium]
MYGTYYLADFTGSRINNITLMRLVAALFVLFGHCYSLSNGKGGTQDPISELIRSFTGFHMGLPGLGVATFFTLSGFLITGSYAHWRSLPGYLESRILRIYPALFVAVLFCIGIGAFVSELPLWAYLTHPATIRFLWSNGSLIEFWPFLPQVFVDNPWPNGTNGSLWTLPVEARMYIIVATVGMLGFVATRERFNFAMLILIAGYLLGTHISSTLTSLVPLRLALFFLLGAVSYTNARLIPMRFSLLCIVGIAAAILYRTGCYDYAFSVFLTYLILLIAYHPRLQVRPIDRIGDLSYGTYLYAFPITQISVKYLGAGRPLLIAAVVISLTLILARLSWVFVEKPALEKKGRIVRIVNVWRSKLAAIRMADRKER